jgi:hypothetical protein
MDVAMDVSTVWSGVVDVRSCRKIYDVLEKRVSGISSAKCVNA